MTLFATIVLPYIFRACLTRLYCRQVEASENDRRVVKDGRSCGVV